ncbi:hypothetical protein, variant [Salpingoeca rosetta]|uniref:Uncharacterized protein n=1 Tax=Salpingoeca rosetta (strain ATCC 50818 / BSB-021) TaxID=946362 RepID=F2USY8_SALR5|nr:hypothetical protein, variant [Salpingoeca rosetta]EGD81246.1 hypothetical protein, variant [Salpingoeca rosetta]|eukprot:XP_004987780.1 hypothetical protein, variant [Salpingoeca rosetta]
MEWEEQLWTHTSMVMVGTSNHSDAVMCRATSQEGKEAAMNDTHHHHHHQPFPISLLFYLSSAVITALTTTIDGTAAITPGRHQPQSGVRQTLHISVALMKSVEEAHEAVEPTTMMKVRGPCIPSPSNRPSKAAERASKGHGVARGRLFSPFPPPATTATTTADDVWLHLDALALCLSSISTCSSSSLVTNSSDCDRGCGGCDVRRCAVASRDDAAGGVADLFPSPHDTTRAIHAHTNVPEKKARGGRMRVSPTDFLLSFPNKSPLLCVIIIISLPHAMCSC